MPQLGQIGTPRHNVLSLVCSSIFSEYDILD